MRILMILPICALLGGCFGPRTYAQGSSEYLDDYECRVALKTPGAPTSKAFNGLPYESYQACRADKIYVGEMLSRVAVQQAPQQVYVGPAYFPAPVETPAPMPNILPQQTRCQTYAGRTNCTTY